jgi:Fur family peroxide stress response transcriptional regulator
VFPSILIEDSHFATKLERIVNLGELETSVDAIEQDLRRVLEGRGQRCTAQRVAVYRFLHGTDIHPTAEEVFLRVRGELPGISLATVYKSLETLVGCGLARKLSYRDTSNRYDGRTEPHLHARCLACGRIADVPGGIPSMDPVPLKGHTRHFRVTGFRMELTGYCTQCDRVEAAKA